ILCQPRYEKTADLAVRQLCIGYQLRKRRLPITYPRSKAYQTILYRGGQLCSTPLLHSRV
ncbi:MAG: hypothetical protein ABR988_17335, partial [Terriglobales bacterium]